MSYSNTPETALRSPQIALSRADQLLFFNGSNIYYHLEFLVHSLHTKTYFVLYYCFSLLPKQIISYQNYGTRAIFITCHSKFSIKCTCLFVKLFM